MAKWNINPFTTGGSLSGQIAYDTGETKGTSSWRIEQDHKPFVENAKIDRDLGTKQNIIGAKKFATIPDIVAIEIMEKYGINIHDPEVFRDRETMMKFKRIVMQDYPYLVVNKA